MGGKCKYLWQIVTSFAHGNPAGTFEEGKEPKAVHRSCLRSPSEEMDLKGLRVISCNEHSDPNFRVDPVPFVFDEPGEPEPNIPNNPVPNNLVLNNPALNNPALNNLPLVKLNIQKDPK